MRSSQPAPLNAHLLHCHATPCMPQHFNNTMKVSNIPLLKQELTSAPSVGLQLALIERLEILESGTGVAQQRGDVGFSRRGGRNPADIAPDSTSLAEGAGSNPARPAGKGAELKPKKPTRHQADPRARAQGPRPAALLCAACSRSCRQSWPAAEEDRRACGVRVPRVVGLDGDGQGDGENKLLSVVAGGR